MTLILSRFRVWFNETQLKTTIEIQQLSDIDLLEYVCGTDGNEVGYKEFVRRYIDDVYAQCESLCRQRRLDKHIGKQIAHDAFENLRKYKSFNRTKLKNGVERRAILGLTYTVCVNLFNDYYNEIKRGENDVPLSSYFDEIASTVKTDLQHNKQVKDFTQRILKKLNAKEIKVLQADMEYKRHQKYLPDHVVASLCEELNVKEPAIRKLRERLIAKIKKEIDVINGQQ